jgi:hypothetical protein
VLAAIFSEKHSRAALLLMRERVTHPEVVRYISRRESPPPPVM